MGSATFRRRIVEMIPIRKVKEITYLIDTLDRQSRAVFDSKKAALLKGDEDVMQQVGEGKDLLSIMREHSCSALQT